MDTIRLNVPKELISRTEEFDAKTPITRMISSIDKYGAVVVNKARKYYGIIDNRALYRFGSGAAPGNRESAEKFAIRVPIIVDSTPIDDVLLSFYESRTKALPYFSGSRIKGVLKRFTMLKIMLSLEMLGGIQVSEAMTTPALAIDANANLSQAKAAMRERRVNRLVVLQNSRLYGIITNHDLVHKFAARAERLPEMKSTKYAPSNVPLSSVATTTPVSIDYGKNLADAARGMIENNVSSIIVTRSGRPTGIVTVFDIFGSVISRRHIEDHKIFISGLDARALEYEDEIREEMKAFMRKVEKIKDAHALYVTLNIKRVRSNQFEMHARLSIERQGTVNMHASGYTIESTLGALLSKLMKEVRRKKEQYIKIRNTRQFREDIGEDALYVD